MIHCNTNDKYPNYSAEHVSGINLIRYAHNQKIGKSNNCKQVTKETYIPISCNFDIMTQ